MFLRIATRLFTAKGREARGILFRILPASLNDEGVRGVATEVASGVVEGPGAGNMENEQAEEKGLPGS